jgi:hypothetical protein
MADHELAAGDAVVHGEVAYPEEEPDREPEPTPVLVGAGASASDDGPDDPFLEVVSGAVSD